MHNFYYNQGTFTMSDTCLNEWIIKEEQAETMIALIGTLYRQHNVVVSIFGQGLINRSALDILRIHRSARHRLNDMELNPQDTLSILQTMNKLDLGACSVDLGKMIAKFNTKGCTDLAKFVRVELESVTSGKENNVHDGTDVVLYGFGRIGRLVARILIAKTGNGDRLRLRAIVVRKSIANDLIKRVSLLHRDSVHGRFNGTICADVENNCIIANGNRIQVIYADDPTQIDYEQYNIHNALLIDNTGKWRDIEGLSQHLRPGIAKVLLTAPGKDGIKNIVHGVNHQDLTDDDQIISAASCTTNAIVPVLKAVNDKYGINSGHVETVHAYTNDQNLIDNFHKGSRRGRSAALNMVLTETGAAKAVAKALPELAGKLTGNAIRVPTPNVSMAILHLNLDKSVSRDNLNEHLRQTAMHSDLSKQIDYVSSPEIVSSDFVGSRYAGIIDSQATICHDKSAILYVWYDNEFGYSCQVVRIMEDLCGVNPPSFPQIN